MKSITTVSSSFVYFAALIITIPILIVLISNKGFSPLLVKLQ